MPRHLNSDNQVNNNTGTRLFDQQSEDTFSAKLARERDLLLSAPSQTLAAAKDHIANANTLVIDAGIGLTAGLALGALAKNPAILGKLASPVVRTGLEQSGKVFAAAAASDWVIRIGGPVLTTWNDKSAAESAKKKLAHNIGSGLLDYGIGFASGALGAGIAHKLTKPWINHSPEFNLNPSEAIQQKPYRVENPQLLSTQKEITVKDDVVALYEKSFPKSELQPTTEVKELVESGRMAVHTTRDKDGSLRAFSFISIHDENPLKFANLDYIATEQTLRSTGIGSLHAERLSKMVKNENPTFTALTLEMEHPLEVGIEAAESAIRARRSKFYDRLDAPFTNIKYNIIDFEDPAYRGMAQWRAWVYKPQEFHPVQAARNFMLAEGGYGLKPTDKAVREFDRLNNYWVNPFSTFAIAGRASAVTAMTAEILQRPI